MFQTKLDLKVGTKNVSNKTGLISQNEKHFFVLTFKSSFVVNIFRSDFSVKIVWKYFSFRYFSPVFFKTFLFDF